MSAKSPHEILEYTSQVSVAKADRSIAGQIILAIMAGVFIAFSSEGSNMAAFNLFANPATYGLGKVLAGAVFGTGLMLVVVAGGELFTGNALMIVGILDKKVKIPKMLLNWFWVYVGNFAGSLLVAYMMNKSNLFNSGAFLLGGQTIKIAAYKTSLSFEAAFFLGIMCNWLVCLAVWVSYASHDVSGKLLTCFFIIGLFITSGFEHCVANMYYIPAGILAKSNADWAAASGLTAEALANLNWGSFAMKNLLPVTLGNIVGGAMMVGVGYWFGLKKKKK